MKKILLAIVLTLFCSLSCLARARAQGYASQSGAITTQGLTSTTTALKTFPLSTITVYLSGTTNLASIYSDNSGTVKANPFTAGADASWFFYADDGRYSVRVSGTGVISPFTLPTDIILYDSAVDYASSSNLGQTFLDIAPTASASPKAVGINSVKYLPYNVRNYGAVLDGSTDDTTALRNCAAAATAAGGYCWIPPGVLKVTDVTTLTSGARIVGSASSNSLNISQIKLTTTNAQVFKIGENTQDITIQDIEIKATSKTNTIGIYGTGAYPNSAQRITFEHINITGFKYGIDVEATDGSNQWQFSYVGIYNSWFEDNTQAIRLNSTNTEWNIENCQFSSPVDAFGIYILKSGPISLSNSHAVGPPGVAICNPGTTPNVLAADTFLQINGTHGPIRVSSSIAEGFRNFLVNDWEEWNYPLTLINNNIGGLLKLNQDIVVSSMGNIYYMDSASAAADVRIFSLGDFWQAKDKCGSASAAVGDFQLSGGAYTVFKSNAYGNRFTLPVAIGSAAPNSTDSDPTSASNPMLRVGSSISNDILFRFGTTNAAGVFQQYYDQSRDGTSGFWKVAGSQAIPNRGLDINFPIQMAGSSSVNVSDASKGVLNYNANAQLFQISENGGAFKSLVKSATTLTANKLARITTTGDTVIANSILEDDGTNLKVSSATALFQFGGTTSSFPALKRSSTTLQVRCADDSAACSFSALNATFTGTLGVTGTSTLGAVNSGAVTASAAIKSTAGISSFFKGADVASASSIAPTGNIFHVTGTTSITSVDATGIQAGTEITIIFDGILTFTDGSNLVLAGNFVTTANDTITLKYDGTNWYEIARSVN